MHSPRAVQPQRVHRLPRVALFITLGLLLVAALAACDQSGQVRHTSPSPTVSPVATLPPLAPEPGWHTVLKLRNTSVTEQGVQGSFVTSTPYRILFACIGSGSLKVTYTDTYGDTTQTAPCGASPPIPNLAEGTPPGTQARQTTIIVQGNISGDALWEALVEVQD